MFVLTQEYDRYEAEGIDDDEDIKDDPKARRKAEKELDSRDQANLMAAEVDEYLDDDLSEELRERDRRKAFYF